MRAEEIIKELEKSKLSVFTFLDLTKLLSKDENYVKVFVHRLTNKKLLRIEKNKYALKGTNPFLIATNLLFPSYLSFISAYSYYNLTTQLPRIYYVVTLKQKKEVRYGENLIKFVKFKSSRFFGFKKELLEDKFMFVAEIEKAIVDSLYLPRYCNVSETFSVLKNAELDEEKLLKYADRMNSSAVLQRLGFLLEILGIQLKLRRKFKNYILLNPTLPKRGERNERWKVIINEAIE